MWGPVTGTCCMALRGVLFLRARETRPYLRSVWANAIVKVSYKESFQKGGFFCNDTTEEPFSVQQKNLPVKTIFVWLMIFNHLKQWLPTMFLEPPPNTACFPCHLKSNTPDSDHQLISRDSQDRKCVCRRRRGAQCASRNMFGNHWSKSSYYHYNNPFVEWNVSMEPSIPIINLHF